MENQQTAVAVADTVIPKKVCLLTDEVVQLSFRLPKSRWKRLKELGLDERASVQSLIVTALEAEFSRRGLKF